MADPGAARRLCAIQPQAQVPITGLTPRQAIELVGRMRGASRADVRRRADRLIDVLDIGEWRDTDGDRLSGGVKRLTSFCMAAVTPGRLVILDEPTNDVDPVRRRLLWAQVRALGDEGVAVLLVTHNVVEAERSVDGLVLLDAGRVVAAGTPATLKAGLAEGLRLELVPEPGRSPVVPAALGTAVETGGRLVVTIPSSLAGEAVAWAVAQQRDGSIEEFALAPATLEDAYIAIVDRQAADRAARPRPWRPSMSLLRSYLLLLQWQALRMKGFLPIAMLVQGLFAFGIVAGYPLLFPAIDTGTILFLATGAPAITLLTMGLVAIPQVVAAAKQEGSLEYVRTLPVPRLAFLLADLTVWTGIVLPGVVFAVIVATIRFGLPISATVAVVPVFLLVALTAACVGYALASVLPPLVAGILSQVLVVFVLMFSPLNFPADRLPDWLRAIHAVLPIQAMGESIRGSLAPDGVPARGGPGRAPRGLVRRELRDRASSR